MPITYPNLIAAQGPVGYWRFEEPSGLTAADSSGNGLNGTHANGPTYAVASALDNSVGIQYSKASSEYTSIPHNALLDFGDTCSFTFWIKRNSATLTTQGIMGKGANGPLIYLATTGEVVFNKGGVGTICTSSQALDTALWHHVAVLKSGLTTKIYIDGVDRSGAITNQTLANTITNLTWGLDISTYGDISLDEVAVFNRLLTEGEVVAQATNPDGPRRVVWINTTTATGAAVSKPGGTKEGDILLVSCTDQDALIVAGTAIGSGPWTEMGGGVGAFRTFWKFAGASEPASYTVNNGGGRTVNQMSAYRFVDPDTPHGTGLFSSGNSATMSAPSVTKTAPGQAHVAMIGGWRGGNTVSVTYSGAYDERAKQSTGGTNSSAHGILLDQINDSTGATGAVNVALGNTLNWRGRSALLLPAAVPPDPSSQEITDVGGIASAEAFGTPDFTPKITVGNVATSDSGATRTYQINAPLPAGILPGDVLVCTVALDTVAALDVTPILTPAGWFRGRSSIAGGLQYVEYFRKVSGAEGSSVLFSTGVVTDAYYFSVAIRSFRGAKLTADGNLGARTDASWLNGSTASRTLAIPGDVRAGDYLLFGAALFNATATISSPVPPAPPWSTQLSGRSISSRAISTALGYMGPTTEGQSGSYAVAISPAATYGAISFIVLHPDPHILDTVITGAGGIPSAENFPTPTLYRIPRGQALNNQTGGNAGTTSIVIPTPAGTIQGDLIVAMIYCSRPDPVAELNIPAGWTVKSVTSRVQGAASAVNTVMILEHWVGATAEPASYSLTQKSGSVLIGWQTITLSLRGVDSSFPEGTDLGVTYADGDATDRWPTRSIPVGNVQVYNPYSLSVIFVSAFSAVNTDAALSRPAPDVELTELSVNPPTHSNWYSAAAFLHIHRDLGLDTTLADTAATQDVAYVQVHFGYEGPNDFGLAVRDAGGIPSLEAFGTPALTVWLAPPIIRSQSTLAQQTFTNTFTIAKPPDVVEGDFLVCIIGSSQAQAGEVYTVTPPGGWGWYTSYSGSAENIYVYYKTATASEPVNYTFGMTRAPTVGTFQARMWLGSIKNVHTAIRWLDPPRAYGVNFETTAHVVPETLHPINDLLHITAVDDYVYSSVADDQTPQVGYTEIAELGTTSVSVDDRDVNRSMMVAIAVLRDRGSTGIITHNSNLAGWFASMGLLLRPTYGWVDDAGNIPSQEAFGIPSIPFILPVSIPSAEAFGDLRIDQRIEATPIPSEETFGLPIVADPSAPEGDEQTLTGAGAIASVEVFNNPAVAFLTNPSDPTRFGLSEDYVELVDARTIESKTFEKPEGGFTKVIAQQLHWVTPVGTFEDLDFTFRLVGASDWIMDGHNMSVYVHEGSDPIEEDRPYVSTVDRGSNTGLKIFLPSVPDSVDGNTVTFTWRNLEWRYQVREQGLKLATEVYDFQGGQGFEFEYELIGDIPHPYIDEEGNLVTSLFTVPRAFAIGANGFQVMATPWDVVTQYDLPPEEGGLLSERQGSIAFSVADTDIEAILDAPRPDDEAQLPGEEDDPNLLDTFFPYTIDPTIEYEIAQDARDLYVQDAAPVTGTTRVVARRYMFMKNGNKKFTYSVGLLSFDSRHIPDESVLTRARVGLYFTAKVSPNAMSWCMDYYQWVGGAADYTTVPQRDAYDGGLITALPLNQYHYVDLLNVTSENIRRDGDTKIRVHVDGGTPSGDNRIELVSNEDAVLPPPILIVDYEEAAAFRSSRTAQSTAAVSAVNVPIPAGVLVEDTLIACIAAMPPSGATRVDITPPAGWSAFPGTGQDVPYATTGRVKFFYKRIVDPSAEPSSYQFDFSIPATGVGGMVAYNGVTDLENNVTFVADTVAATVVPSPARALAGERNRILRVWLGHNLTAPGGAWTMPYGVAKRAEVANTGVGPFWSMVIGDEVQNVGTSAAKNATVSVSRTNRMGAALVLNPALFIAPVESITSEEAFGVPTLLPGPIAVDVNSIVSLEDFRFPILDMVLRPQSILSAEAFGTPQILRGIGALPIASAEAFGTLTLLPQATWVYPDPIASAEAFGLPNLRLFLGVPQGIASAEAFGAPSVTLVLPPIDVQVAKAKQESLMISGERGDLIYEPRLWISNVYGEEIRELPGVISMAVDLSNQRDNTWGLTLQCEVSEAFDPTTDFVLATLDVGTWRDPMRRYPLGLYRFDLPQGTDEPENSFWNLQGYSLEWLLLRHTDMNGFKVKKGGSVFAAIRKIIDDNGIPRSRLTMPPDVHDKTLRKGAKFDPIKDSDGALYIRMANQILSMAGFGALQTTATGQFFFNKIVPFENKHPTAHYGPRDNGGMDMILYEAISREADYSRFANEVLVYNANTTSGLETTAKPIKYIARNTNPDSPVSIPTLGYTVSKTLQMDDITDEDDAKKVAKAELARSSAYYLKRTIHTIPDPRRGPDEAYVLEAYSTLDIPILEGKWQVVSWKLPLSTNPSEMVMEHVVSRDEEFND